MPRYFFNTTNACRDIDHEGVELPNDATARQYAITYAGDVMSDEPELLRDGRNFRVEVIDEHDRLLFTIMMHTVEAQSSPRSTDE